MQDEQSRGVQARVHVGQHVRHALVLDDRLVELNAFAGIAECCLECRAGNAQRLGADANAAAFEIGEGDGQPLAAWAEQVCFGDATVTQGHATGVRSTDAHLLFHAVDDKTGVVGGHQERR